MKSVWLSRRFSLLLLAASLVSSVSAAESPPTFHIAPSPRGNDAHDGSAANPFATLDRARRAVRERLATAPSTTDTVVWLHGGTYELVAPVKFDAADSGRDGAEVVYRAAPGEIPILSGGRVVTGWTKESDGVFRADLTHDVDFRQLWINDRRAIRARTPNLGETLELKSEKTADGFDLPLAPLAALHVRPNEVELSVLVAWMHKRLRIEKVTAIDAGVHVTINPIEWDAITRQPQGDRLYFGRHYWLENAREFLDAPGEFFLDRASGVLRYRPRAGEDLTRASVIRPELENLILLDGRLNAPVHHLRFEGLTFVHTGWTRPNRFGFVDVQANSLVPSDPAAAVDPQYRHQQRKDRIPAAFQATTADHIVITRNRFARLGGTGVRFTAGGNDNVIAENSFYDLAAGGIEIGEDAHRPTDSRLFPRRNLIANNFLAHIGEDYFGSVAILGYYTDHSTITHNEIASLPYTAISQGWGWGQPLGPLDARDNHIVGNRVTNFLRRLDDGGGLYTTDRQLGSEVAYNFVDRMNPPDDRKQAGAALYPDQFTEGFAWHHNVIADSPRWLHLWNPNIRGNRFTANYADTAAQRNDGPDNVVEPINVVPDRQWTGVAAEIVAQAGLESNASAARNFAAPSELIVESTSTDFQILSGKWTVTDEPASRYGASCQRSSDASAAARWMPILPDDGRYDLSVWRPASSAAATYTIRSGTETHAVELPVQNREPRWEKLGSFLCLAGARTDVDVHASGAGIIADAVRLQLVSRKNQ